MKIPNMFSKQNYIRINGKMLRPHSNFLTRYINLPHYSTNNIPPSAILPRPGIVLLQPTSDTTRSIE